MRKTLKIWFLVAVFGAVSAAAAGLALNYGYLNFPSERERAAGETRARQTDTGEEGEEEDVENRAGWFMRQRLLGLEEIPANARQRAKEQADLFAPALAENRFAPTAIWSSVGPQPLDSFLNQAAYGDQSGRINWVSVHPTNTNIVLLGSSTGGIWRSTNAMAADSSTVAFAPVTDNQVDLAVGSVVFAPSNPLIVYAAMGDRDNAYYGSGILKSTDAGATWTKLTTNGLPEKGFSLSLTVRSNDPNTIYVVRGEPSSQSRNVPALIFDTGVYRSTDGGVNWTKTLDGKVSGLAERPSDPSFLYASVLSSTAPGAAAPGIYKSSDSAATFTLVGGSPDISGAKDYRVAVSPVNSNKIYFYGGVGGDANSNPPVQGDLKLIVMTDDLTAAPTFVTNNLAFSQIDPTQFQYNTYLVADPSVAGRLYIGSRDVYRMTVDLNSNTVINSENLILSYTYNAATMKYDNTERGSKAHSDQQHLAFAGTSSAQFFITHDGGVSRTLDTGATFTKNLNQTLSLDQIIGLSVKPTDQTKIYVGAQDNGTQRRAAGINWKEISGGDGGRNRLLPTMLTKLYSNSTNGTFERIENAEIATGANDSTVPSDLVTLANPAPTGGGHRIAFYPPAEVNGVDNTLYVGTETLAVCTTCDTTTGSWTYPANGNGQDLTRGGTDTINAMAVQKLADSSLPAIYTGSEEGAFWVRQTGSQTFTDRTANLTAAVGGTRFITSIRMDRADPSIAYITVSGFGTINHVLKSTGYGATITRLNFTVDIPVNDFLIDPVIATTFYIGTDIGIYMSRDSGANWNQNNIGIPPVVVMRLEATNAAGSYLKAPKSPESPAANTITAATYGRGVYQANLVPTAATVSISGRVVSSLGRSIANAGVNVTDQNGSVRTARTNAFGYYRFNEVEAGQTYVFNIAHKRYQFSTRVVTITEDLGKFDFTSNN